MEIDFEKCVKAGVEQAMRECELTIGMTLKEAVERQVAKKPIKTDFASKCPNCGVYFLFGFLEARCKHCENCGQKIDWN